MFSRSRETYGKERLLFRDNNASELSLKYHLLERFTCSSDSKLLLFNEDGINIPPYACQYSRESTDNQLCLIADEEGFVSLVDSTTPSTSKENVVRVAEKWRCHRNAIFDVAWGRRVFATASGDTTAVLWDVGSPKKPLNILRGHSCSLKSVDISRHNPNFIATGSRDGNALIWDSRSKHTSIPPVIRIQDAHAIHDALTPQKKRRKRIKIDVKNQLLHDSRQTVTSVLFQDDTTLITSGAMDGTIKLWDLRMIPSATTSKVIKSPKPKESIRYPGSSSRRRGYTCLTMDSHHSKLYASCTDDTIYQYNLTNCSTAETRTPVCRYTGHFSSSFYVKISLSPDDQFLLSGCDYEKVYIWNTCTSESVASPCARLFCDCSDQMTSVDWCPHDWTKIVTCSDDCVARFWFLSEEWPRKADHNGWCETLRPPLPENTTRTSGQQSSRLCQSHNTTTPVKSSFKPLPDQMSPGFVEKFVDQQSPQQKQTSLRKWMVKSNGSNHAGRTHSFSKTKSKEVKSNKENSLSSFSLPKRVSRRKVLGVSNTPSPEKVEFRSQKPRKIQSGGTKLHRTMEDFFL